MSSSSGEFFGTERFSIRRRVGAGGMGVVYEVYDRERDKIVALKTLLRADASAIYRFKKEFRSLADVSHRNLVSLYELVAEGDFWFFTMEMIEGVNFLQHVTRAQAGGADTDKAQVPTLIGVDAETMPVRGVETMPGPDPMAEGGETIDLREMRESGASFSSLARPALPPLPAHIERLRPALRQLAEGVCALHDMGKLHRDIKPSNVLVTREGRLVILDFGLIMEMVAEGDTHSLQVVGTPAYMSPEQGAGRSISEASDWYSVGVILYEALTGRLPFTGQYVEVLLNKQKFEPPPPSQLVSGIPEDLDSLCRDLLRRDPSARPSGSEVLKRLGVAQAEESPHTRPLTAQVRDVPFVGRERQISALKDSFLATKAGRTATVYIHGQSGMGKSALVRRFLEDLQESENAVIVSGRCYERESVPYKALDGVIDSLSRYLMSLPRLGAEALMPRDVLALSRLFPVMLRVDAVASAPYREQEISDALALRRRAFAALRELLTRLADRQPLVIYIDDLQWADADSTTLLEDLLRPPDPPPLLLIASFRSEEIESKTFLKQMLARARAGTADYRAIEVEPLTRDEARDLAHALLPRQMPGAEHFVEAIVREAGGSPFFVEQLTRYALASERAATTGISLAEMLDAGLSQLPPGSRALLETLAVAGRPVDPDIVFSAAGLSGDAHALVTSLRASHFLRSSGSAQHIELYHDRIRETLASLLAPDGVRSIHASLARTLESRGIEDPEALFEHYLGAGERKLAAGQAVLAAKRADAALAFDRAALFYRKALQLGPIKGTNIVDLKSGLGSALANAGRSAEAAEAYLDAALDVDTERGLDFQSRAAAQLLMGGHIDEGLDVIRTLLEAVGLKLAPGPKRALLSLVLRRAHLKLRGINFKERSEANVSREDLRKIDICWSVAAGLGMVDNIRAADFQTRGLLLALQAGEPHRIARALAFEAAFSASPGGPDQRRPARYLKMAEALARKVDDPHAMGLVTFTEGMSAYLVGQWKKAARLCDEASEILRDRCTGAVWELSTAQRITLSALMLMGELGEISRRLPGWLAAAKEQGNLYAATDLRTRLNMVWLADDDPDGAREEVIAALLEWSQGGFHVQHYNSLQALTQIELYTGDGVVAWKHITGQWETIRKSMLLRIQILRVEALFLQGRSALAAARERRDDQFLKMAEHFASRLARERMHWTRPLSLLLRAGIAALRDDSRRASALLSQAADGFEAADMKLYAAAARRHLGSLTGDSRGHEMIMRSDLWMRSQMIKNPARMTRMLAPGFDSDPDS